jgi:HK97 family phage prohead protease/HK97 family phage major capsid protein
MDAQKEIRKAEIQSASGRTVSGYAVRFETESVNMGFVEIIKRGAITEETIKTSDVFALLNHNENTVLARSNHGVGSLTLTVDNDGVYYEFEAPNTANGDELLEHIKRGEISQSSFAFTVSNEDGAETWTKRSDGVIVRQINKIARLYDISPVYQPAYTETTCSRRALEKISELNKDMEDNKDLHNEADLQEIELLKAIIDEQEQKIKELQEAQTEPEQTEPTDENRSDDEDEKKDKEEIENEPSDTQINNTESEPEPTDESTDNDEDEEKEKNQNNRNISNMEKFSLTKEIRSAIESGTNKVDMRAYTVTDEGTDVVGTDVFDIFAPLRAKNVLTDLGVRYIGGIKNNVVVPVGTPCEAKFANETADASNGSGAIGSVKLSPKRITAKVPVSLELLAQDSVGVEQMIREDLQNAVYTAIEDKVFGRQAESTDVYAGLINGVANASISDVSTFAALMNMEATVENANVDVSKCKYVVSPSAKAKLRAMPKSTKTTELVMQNGEIDGTEVMSTGHLNDVSVGVIYADWSNIVVGTWDNVQIDTVRDTESLSNGTVNLIVNAYVDVKCARKNAFAFGKVS